MLRVCSALAPSLFSFFLPPFVVYIFSIAIAIAVLESPIPLGNARERLCATLCVVSFFLNRSFHGACALACLHLSRRKTADDDTGTALLVKPSVSGRLEVPTELLYVGPERRLPVGIVPWYSQNTEVLSRAARGAGVVRGWIGGGRDGRQRQDFGLLSAMDASNTRDGDGRTFALEFLGIQNMTSHQDRSVSCSCPGRQQAAGTATT